MAGKRKKTAARVRRYEHRELFAQLREVAKADGSFAATSLIETYRAHGAFSPRQAAMIVLAAQKAVVFVRYDAIRVDLRRHSHRAQIEGFASGYLRFLKRVLTQSQKKWLATRLALSDSPMAGETAGEG